LIVTDWGSAKDMALLFSVDCHVLVSTLVTAKSSLL